MAFERLTGAFRDGLPEAVGEEILALDDDYVGLQEAAEDDDLLPAALPLIALIGAGRAGAVHALRRAVEFLGRASICMALRETRNTEAALAVLHRVFGIRPELQKLFATQSALVIETRDPANGAVARLMPALEAALGDHELRELAELVFLKVTLFACPAPSLLAGLPMCEALLREHHPAAAGMDAAGRIELPWARKYPGDV